ncbi:putative maltose permease [Talaromyces proteolyticus]|uniref:Maltose permease n=1 Tax=Talaromyces proteolyticus TaxID=1131652 RepID=A0AAD4KQV8_9EURO|nr:putative maltose permease [Talaromyces proteolyticus]KAH8693602.1 putative maltose permease [Talaromyces proteolyticus]
MEKDLDASHLESTQDSSEAQVMERNANEAIDVQVQMGFYEAVRLYSMAVVWSLGLSTAVIMEGYAVMLLSSFYALPQFNRKYGQLQPDGSYVIPASWKSGLSNGALCGEILGLFFTGIIQDRFGYRMTILAALCLITGFIFIPFFAQNVEMLLVGEILCGIPWGAFQTVTTAYASEVCPVALRAYLTTYVNLCWVIGQFLVSGVLKAVLERQDQWAYRIPFAVQWIWPVPLVIICILAPESPWWCVRHGQVEEARRSLIRLTSRSYNMVEETLSMIQYTDQLEKETTTSTSYWECFKGENLRRTEIVCLTWLIQVICGSQLMGYSTVFYIAAGLPESASFNMSLIQYALGAVGTVLSWFLMARAGRRTIYLYGSFILFCLLLIIGMVSLAPRSSRTNWTIGALLSVFTFVYDLTVGSVCYSLVSELSSTRLRAKSVVLARNLYNIGGIVVNIFINYQLTTTAWNWGAKSAFFWAGVCFCCVVWIFFRLPEPKGRTYAELDVLFAQKVSARDFASTQVDVFRSTIVRKG